MIDQPTRKLRLIDNSCEPEHVFCFIVTLAIYISCTTNFLYKGTRSCSSKEFLRWYYYVVIITGGRERKADRQSGRLSNSRTDRVVGQLARLKSMVVSLNVKEVAIETTIS